MMALFPPQQYMAKFTKVVLLSLLFCPACMQQNSGSMYGQFTDSVAQQQADDAPIMNEAESESEIQQELDALNRSGTWQNPTIQDTSDASQKNSLSYFPVIYNKQVEAYIALFQGKQRRSFTRFLKRSGKYIGMIEKELIKNGMPRELAYLALVESGFNPRARSRAKATGLWQFMAGTAKDYKLKINRHLDERCSAEKSTKAAIRYLKNLYADFGDWYLAVAAYNAGPGKIRSGMKKHKVDNFWDLAAKKHLRLETIRYVPKLLATITIARDPQKFGFSPDIDKPLQFDTLSVGPSLALKAVAFVAGCKKKAIIQLNPELLKEQTPPNYRHYTVKIPKGKKALAESNMKRLHCVVSTAYKTHKVGKKESLARIAKKYNINVPTLVKVNNLQTGALPPGKSLRIPYSTIKYKLLPKGKKASEAALANSGDMILHRIKQGDTLGAIAKRYHVPVNLIVRWNGLRSAKRIRAGQQLALFIDEKSQDMLRTTPSPGHLIATKTKRKYQLDGNTSSSTSPLTISAVKKKISHGKQKKNDAVYYSVKNGDSLWTISRKFNISMAEIKKLNSLKSNLLKPGSTLRIRKS